MYIIRVNGGNMSNALNVQECDMQIVKYSDITTVTSAFLLSPCEE
jgi:hypothetical protein